MRGALLLLGLAVAAMACSGVPPTPRSPAVAYRDDAAALKRGRLLFTGTCGGYCHPTRPGSRDAPYLFDCTWKHGGSDAELYRSISDGFQGTRMPAWGGKLPEPEADIWRLIAYIRSASSCGAAQRGAS